MADPTDGRSIGQLFSDLTSNLTRLVRGERELFQAELSEKVREFGKAGAEFAAGAVLLLAALLILLQALVLALSHIMDPVWASLLVGVAVATVGVLLLKGATRTAQAQDLKPRRTTEQINKDKQFVKEQVT